MCAGRDVDLEPTNTMAIFPTLADAEKWSRVGSTRCARPRRSSGRRCRRASPGTASRPSFTDLPGRPALHRRLQRPLRPLRAERPHRAVRRGRPVRALGRRDGDPIELGTGRTVEYGAFAKIWLSSTPPLGGVSRTEAAYEESDRQVREPPPAPPRPGCRRSGRPLPCPLPPRERTGRAATVLGAHVRAGAGEAGRLPSGSVRVARGRPRRSRTRSGEGARSRGSPRPGSVAETPRPTGNRRGSRGAGTGIVQRSPAAPAWSFRRARG